MEILFLIGKLAGVAVISAMLAFTATLIGGIDEAD
jgi:hypothetical protein